MDALLIESHEPLLCGKDKSIFVDTTKHSLVERDDFTKFHLTTIESRDILLNTSRESHSMRLITSIRNLKVTVIFRMHYGVP